MFKTNLLIGTAATAAVLAWLWTDRVPLTPELPAASQSSAFIRSESRFDAGSESFDPLNTHQEPGFTAAPTDSSVRADTGARETFSSRRAQLNFESSLIRQKYPYPPDRKQEEIIFKKSARQTNAGQDRASQSMPVNVPKSPPPIPKASEPMTPQVPAAWVQIPDSLYLTRRQQEEIQPMAEALLTTVQAAGQQAVTPAMETASRHAAIRSSDAEFRRKYGQHAWMEHHIQAFHLGLAR